jgi:hypothetical protein
MNTGVELHDSCVAEVVREGSELRVVFRPAYVHRSDGAPGSDPGWGFLQPVEFKFRDAVNSATGECLGVVSDGAVIVSGVEYSNIVPMPLTCEGTATARIEFASRGILTVSAGGFTCIPIGEPDPNFKERYEG